MHIISLQRTFSKATYYYLLYGVAFLVSLAACWFIVYFGHELRQLEVRDYSIHDCSFPGNLHGPVLRVLDAVYMEDLDLITSTWCQSPALAQHYGSLELRSVHRENFDLRDLYDAHYQLILAKPELIDSGGRARKDGIGYEMLAQYPDYGSQLVSLRGTPELTAAWMKGKTLGFLDDPNSVSAYQIPKAALHRAGLADLPTITYFRSYRQLYKALFDGEVDAIPALLSDEGPSSMLKLPAGLVLEETIPGPAWYLHRDLLQEPDGCLLLAALQQLASHARYDYFRDLKIVRPCNAD